MTHRMQRLAAWILPALVAAGCAAGDLRDANDRLTSYYAAKTQAESSENWAMLETSIASLRELSIEAAAEAATQENDLNKVSLYRIAATAAWQGDYDEVVNYGREGQRLCTGEVYEQAPRDCGMLMVIPTLASVDATTDRLNRLQEELDAAGDDLTPEISREADRIKDAYFEAIDRLLNARPEIQRSQAHPDFKAGVDSNISRIQCDLLDGTTRGVLVLSDASMEEFNASLRLRGCRMLNDGFPRDGFSCAPRDCN